MQINRRFLLTQGVLSMAAVALITGCVDDKYDLTDIDTTTRITVDNLTVPVELSKLTLKNVINIDDDDETIKKIPVGDNDTIYAIQKTGQIDETRFNLNTVHVQSLSIGQTSISLPNLPSIPGFKVDLNETIALPVKPEDMQTYNINITDIDKSLNSISNIKTSPIRIEVVLSIPQGLMGGNNKISFQDISLKLPKGLIGSNYENNGYDPATGELFISPLPVEADGKAHLVITANGIDLKNDGQIGADRSLHISGDIGLVSAKIHFEVSQVEIPQPFDITINYSVPAFDVTYFSGNISYPMDDINIDPISLSDLPDFLNDPQTKLFIDNPVILVTIDNPVAQYHLTGNGILNLTSNFGNHSINHKGRFSLDKDVCNFAFCSDNSSYSAPAGYDKIVIPGLDAILTDTEMTEGSGLPNSISVSVSDLKFTGDVVDLPLGYVGSASGSYKFEAPLAFGAGTEIYYNTTENGWDSEDLDGVNVNLISVSAKCTSKLPVDIKLELQPIDKDGNRIVVKDIKPMIVPANCTDYPVSLILESIDKNHPITGFDGVIFEATVTQNNASTTALGPNIELELNYLKVTVDGYFEKEL